MPSDQYFNQPSKHLKAGYHRSASGTPFKWRFAGGPMVVRYCVLDGKISPVFKSFEVITWGHFCEVKLRITS